MAESSDWKRVELHQRPQLMGITIGEPPPAFLERFVGVETPPLRFRVLRDEWHEPWEPTVHNPDCLPERTIHEVEVL